MLGIKGMWYHFLTENLLHLGGSRITKFSTRVVVSLNGREVVGTILLMVLLVSCVPALDRGQIYGADEIFKGTPVALRKAYSSYWEARAKKHHKDAYLDEVPDFRAAITLGQYSNYLRLYEKADLGQVKPQSVTCLKKHICFVETALTYVLKDGVHDVRYVKDCWEEWNGQWFHRIRDPLIFPGLDELHKETETNK